MYNEDIKNKFISYLCSANEYNDSTIKLYTEMFNLLGEFEQNEQADLYEMDAERIKSAVQSAGGTRHRSLTLFRNYTRLYLSWCMENGLRDPGEESGLETEIPNASEEDIRKKFVANPIQLQRYLDMIYDPESEKTIDNIYRMYHWLSFSGMTEREIFSARNKDVDFMSMEIHTENDVKPLYRESLRTVRNCVELTQFVYKHPNYTKDIIRDRVPGDILMRGVKTDHSTLNMRYEINRKANKCRSKTGMVLSAKNIWYSGMFYRAYQQEQAGIEPDLYDIALRVTDENEHKSEKTRLICVRNSLRCLKKDYSSWKSAYYSK